MEIERFGKVTSARLRQTRNTSGVDRGVRAAGAAENLEQAQRRLQKQKPVDTAAAEQWAQALSRARVYLLSRLDEEQVEQLGAAHVAGPVEIGRLIERTESCVLLANAQYALPTAVGD